MTTKDVIAALLANGWRRQRLGKGLDPVLTNTPRGRIYCVSCGFWIRPKNYYKSRRACVECIRERNSQKGEKE